MNSNDIKVKGKLGDVVEVGHDARGYWKRLAGHDLGVRDRIDKAEYRRILDAAYRADMTMTLDGRAGVDLRVKLDKWVPFEACSADGWPQPTRAEALLIELRQGQREQAVSREHYAGRIG